MKTIYQIMTGTCLLASLFTFNVSANEEISGAEVINNNCARCHNARSINEFSISEWQVIMPHMRQKAHLTGSETEAVLQFISTVLGPNGTTNAKTTSQKMDGKQLFNKYGCQGCHSLKGVGGKVGPALDSIIEDKGKAFVKQKLANPQFNNSASPMPMMSLSEEQISAIVEYIKSN